MICIHTSKECQHRVNFIHCSYSECIKDHPEKFPGGSNNGDFAKVFSDMFGGKNPFGNGGFSPNNTYKV